MLSIDPEAGERMREDAEAAYPGEASGLLLGRRAGEALEARGIPNLEAGRSPDRYRLDPRRQMDAEKEAAARGLRVVGVWHSHPDRPATPSETDRERAHAVWGDAGSWSYVILEVAKGAAVSRRSWVLKGGAFEEEGIR